MGTSVGAECRQAGKRAGRAIYIADSTGHSRSKARHGTLCLNSNCPLSPLFSLHYRFIRIASYTYIHSIAFWVMVYVQTLRWYGGMFCAVHCVYNN